MLTRLVVALLPVLFVAGSAYAESLPGVRFHVEAGPSFDQSESSLHDRAGYALAGGIELGRKLALVVTGGYERYGGEVEPYLANTGQSGPIPPTVRGAR